MIMDANHSIYIITPYLIPDFDVIMALKMRRYLELMFELLFQVDQIRSLFIMQLNLILNNYWPLEFGFLHMMGCSVMPKLL